MQKLLTNKQEDQYPGSLFIDIADINSRCHLTSTFSIAYLVVNSVQENDEFIKLMLTITDLCNVPEHLHQLATWHHEQWSHLYPGQTIDDRTKAMQSYLDNTFIPSTFVAIDSVVLGSAAIIENDMETRPELTPWLASVYVDERNREQGIGTRLVKHVIEKAAENTIKKIYLFTPDKQFFYSSMGWRLLDRENYHGEDVSIMVYEID